MHKYYEMYQRQYNEIMEIWWSTCCSLLMMNVWVKWIFGGQYVGCLLNQWRLHSLSTFFPQQECNHGNYPNAFRSVAAVRICASWLVRDKETFFQFICMQLQVWVYKIGGQFCINRDFEICSLGLFSSNVFYFEMSGKSAFFVFLRFHSYRYL